MNKIKHLRFFFFLLALVTINSSAESVYNVEILIFEHAESTNMADDEGQEQWGEGEESALYEDHLTFSAMEDIGEEEELINELPSSSLNLVQTRGKLEASDKYRVLYHKGWSQPVLSKEESMATSIVIPSVLEGTINLHQKKYLHLTVDLQFNSLKGLAKLEESRRLKSKELHYLDHPLFGMLVRVVKL